jgi:hypothetical protein
MTAFLERIALPSQDCAQHGPTNLFKMDRLACKQAGMFAHVPIAIGLTLLGWLIGARLGAPRPGALWLGWFAGACACVMREITQHEYRWIEAYGGGKRAAMPPLEGLKVWDWNAHSQWETIVALGVSGLLVAILTDQRV